MKPDIETIIFATGNTDKFRMAQTAFTGTGFHLIQSGIEIPEIQDNDIRRIASFSASWACDKLRKPVVVTDVGYFIAALRGFPGPFIRYVNEWLGPDDYLRLMHGVRNREVTVRECLAFAVPGLPVHCITGEAHGTLAEQRGSKQSDTSMNTLFIPDGFGTTKEGIAPQEMTAYWNRSLNTWPRFVRYLKSV